MPQCVSLKNMEYGLTKKKKTKKRNGDVIIPSNKTENPKQALH